ncbi:Cytochrome P450 monooxygenase FUM2 [Colletotrichum tropicale]|nr:Cytochrome P450 monooxygenase FUM2 [Colletotrichum tropicale]
MADLAFGEPLGLLACSSYSEWVGNIFGNLKAIAQIGREWPWLGNLVQMVTPHHLKKASELHFAHAIERVDRRIKPTKEDADIWNWVLSQPDSRQITKGDMYTNSSLFMVAGSETTATILLLKNPNKLARLVTGIRQVDEALRWYPPVPVGVLRELPEGGGTVAGHWASAMTCVSVPQFAANHSSRTFKDPGAFIPERLLPGPDFKPNNKDVVQPFSLGPQNCIGMK